MHHVSVSTGYRTAVQCATPVVGNESVLLKTVKNEIILVGILCCLNEAMCFHLYNDNQKQ